MVSSKRRVLIATPSYGSMVTTSYTTSLLALMNSFRETVDFSLQFLDYSLICKQRNFFISRLLEEDFTHLLFIDADMGFSVDTIKSLFELNKPVTACAYPTRALDWARVQTAARQPTSLNTMKANALGYVLEPSLNQGIRESLKNGGKQLTLQNEKFIACREAGTGLMLVQKTVAEQLRQAYPDLWVEAPSNPYPSFGNLKGVLQCFEALQNDKGQYISEDLSFCRRWVEGCQGEIWVNIKDPITHSGKIAFNSAFLDRFVDR